MLTFRLRPPFVTFPPIADRGEGTREKRARLLFAIALSLSLLASGLRRRRRSGDDGGGDACRGGGDGPIWVLLPDTESSERWENDDRRFFTQFFEDAGLTEGDDFTIVNAEGDASTQQSQAEQAIADGASVILLTSLDTGSGATIIDTAKDAGVEVVEYDRFNTGGSGGAAYVSFDNVQVGATMAEVLEPAIDDLGLDPARVVMLNGGEEDNNSFLFRDGYAATVEARADAGDWEIVADQHVPGLGQPGGADDHGADPRRRRQRRGRGVRRQRRPRPGGHQRAWRPPASVRCRSAARTPPRRGSRTSCSARRR